MKTCRKCNTDKPLSAFSIVRGRPHTYCKACRVKAQMTYLADKRAERAAGIVLKPKDNRPAYYADSAAGRAQKRWQSLLNAVPAYSRGNLSPVLA